jgi:S-adenosyl methyltransferase
VTDFASAGAGAPRVDTTVPHSARVWNYWLGGKDNYAADRAIGDQVRQIFPQIVTNARAQREFLARAIRYLAGEAGVRQFLDIGTGLPTAGNTHEIAQQIAPESRIVYVDNDPIVLVHAQALLVGTSEGATDYIDADVRDPDKILRSAARTLDFSQPVGLILLGILGHIYDDDEIRSIIRRLVDALSAGSYVVIADGTDVDRAGNEAQRRYNEASPTPYYLRSPDRLAKFFDGLTFVDPGFGPVSQWRPEPSPAGSVVEAGAVYGGVARKP